MASDASGDEAAFTDCVASGSELPADTPISRRKQLSVPEMVRRAENRKPKRPAPDRSSKSPRDPALPAAKRPLAEPAEPPGVELSAGALAAISQMLDVRTASIINAFEAKFERIERRLDVLESEAVSRELEIQRLGTRLADQIQVNNDLRAQVESMDINRRLASLIFTCDDFGQRAVNEDIEDKLVRLLNNRIQGLNLTTSDIHAAHRLQRDDKVIAKFVKRSVRDRIYDARFNLSAHGAGAAGVWTGAGGVLGPRGRRSALYISESLTSYNQSLYNQLLQVRKASGGTRVASVFSRRGLVYCRTVRGGPNVRVPDQETLQRIIGDFDGGAPASGGRPAAGFRGGRSGRRYDAGASRAPRPAPSVVPPGSAAAGRPAPGAVGPARTGASGPSSGVPADLLVSATAGGSDPAGSPGAAGTELPPPTTAGPSSAGPPGEAPSSAVVGPSSAAAVGPASAAAAGPSSAAAAGPPSVVVAGGSPAAVESGAVGGDT